MQVNDRKFCNRDDFLLNYLKVFEIQKRKEVPKKWNV